MAALELGRGGARADARARRSIRAIKDDEEVAKIAKAARIADRGFEALTAETFVGRSEREIAWRLRELLHAHGADELSFETIVASGENGAMPHAHPTDRIVERGTLVTVDWGVRVDGYCSDCTRTVSTGGLSETLRQAYDVCLEAQKHACANIKAGLTGVEADALARDAITDSGLRRELRPRARPRRRAGGARGTAPVDGVDGHARRGPIITIEPGIYLEGLGGVRIEDLAVVRENGVELLTSFPKELIEVCRTGQTR